jgi:hypothetical protein
MNEPAAIWSLRKIVFDDEISLTQNVILTQGSSALQATINRIDSLAELGPREGNVMFVNSNIAPILQDLCSQAGIATSTLFNNGNKSRFESDLAYKLRVERIAYVKKLCDEQNFKPETLTDREIRNSLIHIDERLADILTNEKYVGWFIDHVASIRNSFEPIEGITIKYCRSYIHNENKILHLGNELDLTLLRQECLAILAIVFGIDGNKK